MRVFHRLKAWWKLALLAVAGIQVGILMGCERPVKQGTALPAKKLFWGDLHNHNSVGYAKGSLERSYEIARSHLDFFCFTGHSQWPDMPVMPGDKHLKWVKGFQVFARNWDKVKRLANQYYQPGKFVPFIGYEWHSSSYGDFHIIFPGPEADLVYFGTLGELQDYARSKGAILIPHHPAYKTGWRGQDWSLLDPQVSPVVEIFSEHGNAELDRGPYPYIRHSMGGRYTRGTVQWLWQQGVEAGVVASSDDHLGYPGAYGEGLVGLYADTLTRESVMEALRSRRTFAVNADRIELDFRLNGHWMGETIAYSRSRKIFVNVKGKGVVDRVEVLRNNRVIYRDHPVDRPNDASSWDRPVLCRVEFGWGPWADLDMARICDWEFTVGVEDGEILSLHPCFQSGPFDERRRNLALQLDEHLCRVVSYTSRTGAYEERATNSVVLEIKGSPATRLTVKLAKPVTLQVAKSLAELAESSEVVFTGTFTSESILLHRLVFAENCSTRFELNDTSSGERTDWYYVRVLQCNGSMAWSSPIWVRGEK